MCKGHWFYNFEIYCIRFSFSQIVTNHISKLSDSEDEAQMPTSTKRVNPTPALKRDQEKMFGLDMLLKQMGDWPKMIYFKRPRVA